MEHNIWQSRKFWITVVDVVVSLTTYFIGKYLNPEAAKDIMTLVLALQPVILLLVTSYTVQNIAGIKADGIVQQAIVYNEGVNSSQPTPVTDATVVKMESEPE